jgi:hypothetical protein
LTFVAAGIQAMNPTTGAVATFVLVIVSGLFGVSMILAAHYRQSWNRKTSPYRSVGHRHDSGVTRAKSSPSVPRQAGSITFCDQPRPGWDGHFGPS